MIKRERDPNLVGLENNIFSKMNEILGPDIKQSGPKTDVKFVSFEDALKELLELEKSSVVPTLTSSQ
jgi:hypothetical protein